jgi:hypothetical protein
MRESRRLQSGQLNGGGFGFFYLVFFLQHNDTVFTLDVGLFRLDAVLTVVDGVGDFFPVFLTDVTPVKIYVTVTPGFD